MVDNNQKPVLVVLAAGLGSRFNGLKQIESVDDDNHILIDYSIYDAIEAGFSEIVFIIRRDFEEQFKEAIGNRISEKIKTMDQMVEDILALSRSESGNVDVSTEEVNVMAMLAESIDQFPDLKTNISGTQVKLKTDRKLFRQAVDNLLSNCDRYGEKGSAVEITVGPDCLTIANKTSETYPDAESLKKPFVKGSDSRSDKGTGLGLSIADNNLNILGYKLVLESSDGVFKATVKFKN